MKIFLINVEMFLSMLQLWKNKLGFVFLLDIEWSDLGSDSIWKISDKDNNGNSFIGNVLIKILKIAICGAID